MLLQQISMYRYGEKEHFEGQLIFKGELGEVKIKVRPGLSDKIVAALAEELVASVKEVSNAMTAEVFTQASSLPSLEDKR